MLRLKSISPSRIKTFDTCKFKYWLTYHCPHIKLKTNWGASHGSLCHDILENYANHNDHDWVARLYRGYGGLLETNDRDGELVVAESPLIWAKAKDYTDKKPYCDTCPHAAPPLCSISREPLDNLNGCPRDLFEGSVSLIQKTIDRYTSDWKKILRDASGKLIGTEYKFNIKVPGTDVPMIGIMDLVLEEDPETIHIIDYKTGVYTQSYQECLEDIQVKMYSLASRREFIDDVSQKGFKYKNIILTFDYFTKQPVTLAFTKEEDDATEKFVYNKIKEIEGTEWINRIVPNNVNFNERGPRGGFKYFKCNNLCDTKVCAQEWKGRFQSS